MSNIVKNIKSKISGATKGSDSHATNANENRGTQNASKAQEPTYSILPHPAKSNDPADLQPSGGLRQGGAMDAFHARDPYVPSEQIKNSMPAPLSHEELQAQKAALNQDHYKP